MKPASAPGPSEGQRRRHLLAGVFTVGAHGVVAAALIWMHMDPRSPQADPTIVPLAVSFVKLPKPPGPQMDVADPGAPQIAQLPPMPQVAEPMLTIASTPVSDTADLLSDSQLAGAASVGDGGAGGGRCNTAQIVQQALRQDPRVRAAVQSADRLGKASLLWNGDWVRSGGQEGKGLAVVRQAVSWKVAFVPEPCRSEPMHGMLVLSLADGRTRFAIGSDSWRWSDLLGLKTAASLR